MKFRPSLEELRQIAETGEYRTAAVSAEMMSDRITPIEALRRFRDRPCFLLESAEAQERWGRYTFIGVDPELCVTARDGAVTMEKDGKAVYRNTDPRAVLRKILSDHKAPRFDFLPPFTGGLVGYFGYDYIQYAEPSLKLRAKDTEGFQDLDLMLFRKVIAFDNFRQKLVVMVTVDLDDLDTGYERAKAEIRAIAEALRGAPEAEPPVGRMTSPIRTLFDEERFCRMVERAKEHIYEGDIFQVVLSNRLEADFEGSLFDAYRVLRTVNPSPYMFYFAGNELEIAGASPETLVKLQDGVLHTFPLAGTRPRGATPEEDRRLEAELLMDEKERAEHNMLVDLGRNDIGKISEFGSVEVEQYMTVHRFSHVMHLGSTVRGRIRPDRDALDAVEAILPAGTLSGAPKIRACQIIDELEDCRRGIYGGAIGYIDLAGNLDTCIAIRIAYKREGRVYVRSGAGIVADSVPENEYRECVNKAKAVVRALEIAQEGIE